MRYGKLWGKTMIVTRASEAGYTGFVKDFFYEYEVIINKKREIAVNLNARGHETKEELEYIKKHGIVDGQK